MSFDGADNAAKRLSRRLASMPEVRLAFLFGSRGRGEGRRDSDFDVALLLDDEVVAQEERGRMIRRIAGQLGRDVSSARLDLVVLNDAPVLLRHRVLRDGIVLFQRSPEERVRFATKTIREYQDGQIRREEFTRRRIQKLKAGEIDGGSGDLLEKARGPARLLDKAQGVS